MRFDPDSSNEPTAEQAIARESCHLNSYLENMREEITIKVTCSLYVGVEELLDSTRENIVQEAVLVADRLIEEMYQHHMLRFRKHLDALYKNKEQNGD